MPRSTEVLICLSALTCSGEIGATDSTESLANTIHLVFVASSKKGELVCFGKQSEHDNYSRTFNSSVKSLLPRGTYCGVIVDKTALELGHKHCYAGDIGLKGNIKRCPCKK